MIKSLVVTILLIAPFAALAQQQPAESDIYLRGVMDECNVASERARILSAERAVFLARISALEAKLKAATEKTKDEVKKD